MADFGAQLREARERKGISLRQIAASTKISVAALEGLERNDISRLPGGIFSRAFVRSYAIEVGLDPDETVKQFLQQFAGDAPLHGSAAPPAAAAPARPPSPPPARAASAAPRAATAVGRSGRNAESRGVAEEVDFESKQKMAAVVLKLVLVSVPIAVGIIYFSSRGSASRPATSPATRPEASAAQEPGPAATEAAVPKAELPAAPAAATSPAPAPAVAEAVAAPPPPVARAAVDASAPMRLDVVPTADCWIRLTVDGSVAVSRVIPAGERESRAFAESAVLLVGDAGACAIAINGQPARPLGREKQVREIRITRDNFRTYLP